MMACGSNSTPNGGGSGGAPSAGGQPSLGGGVSTGGGALGGSFGSGGQTPAVGGSLGSGGGTNVGGGSSGGQPAETGGGETGGAESGAGGASTGGNGASFLFSTDFEGETVAKIPSTGNPSWTTSLPTEYDSGGIVEVQTGAGAHSGSKFVYVKKGGDNQAFLQLADAKVFPFTATKIHVRAFMKVTTWPSSHASWMEVGTVKNEEAEMRFGAHEGVLQVNHWPGDQDQIAPGIKFNVDEWACIEYSYEPGTKTLQVWLEGEPVEALTVTGSFARGGAFDAPPIDALRFGAEINGTDAYYDDIVVHTDFIGCN